MTNNLIIVGAGGHGKVVLDAALRQKKYNIIGFADNGKEVGSRVFGNYTVICSQSAILQMHNINYFIVAIGNNTIREKIFNELKDKLKPAIILHPNAVISDNSNILPGTVVLANAVINPNAHIGNNCIINAMALVDHDSTIGNNTHLSPGTIVGSHTNIPNNYTSELGEKIKS